MKRKKVNVRLLKQDHQLYEILHDLIEKHHVDLFDAKIALAWRIGWTEDADGNLKLGQTKKGSDLDRELHGYDFVILLNHEVFEIFSDAAKRYVIDHELCHCRAVFDEDGTQKTDERGRPVFRIRKHDIEEFTEIVERHGLITNKVRDFARVVLEAKKQPLFASSEQE